MSSDIVPLYRLRRGRSGSSYAVQCAQKAGVADKVLARARTVCLYCVLKRVIDNMGRKSLNSLAPITRSQLALPSTSALHLSAVLAGLHRRSRRT